MKIAKRLFTGMLVVLMAFSSIGSNVVLASESIHQAEYDWISEAEKQLGYEVIINEDSTVIQQRINGTFSVSAVDCLSFKAIVDRNNLFSARLEMIPIAFGGNSRGNITSVDIIVTWSGGGGGTHTFRNVGLHQAAFVPRIPWNAGRYQVLVRANGAPGVVGTVTMRIRDYPA